MGCYAKVDGRECQSNKYLFRCAKCKTITCAPHMKNHAVKCGSFIAYTAGNPNSDRISELEARIEMLTRQLAERNSEGVSFEGDTEDEDDESSASELVSDEPSECSIEQQRILQNASMSCFSKIGALNRVAAEYDDRFIATVDTVDFFVLHNGGDDNNFKFMQSEECRACRRKVSREG